MKDRLLCNNSRIELSLQISWLNGDFVRTLQQPTTVDFDGFVKVRCDWLRHKRHDYCDCDSGFVEIKMGQNMILEGLLKKFSVILAFCGPSFSMLICLLWKVYKISGLHFNLLSMPIPLYWQFKSDF